MTQFEIRNKIKLLRSNLTAYEVETLSDAITKTVLGFDFLQEKSVFFKETERTTWQKKQNGV